MHTNYIAWKTATKTKNIQGQILSDRKSGLTYRELVQKYKVSMSTIVSVCNYKGCENATLFVIAEMWENIISGLNKMRELYLLTGDYNYFRAIRELLPMGYNYRFTWQANYAVLRNIYHARKNHKLNEWHDFCRWVEESLPYSELITEV